MVEWREIRAFPGYSVSDEGFVRNDNTGRLMTRSVNQFGVVNVGLMNNRVQYRRGVALLVAEAFKVRPRESFDTPINLDGDRMNCWVGNLMWRPRWFATRYFRQFRIRKALGFGRPIEEVHTKEYFKSPMEAAVKYGLLECEVIMSIQNHDCVWPTQQQFRIAE